jgi:hypothetical protein
MTNISDKIEKINFKANEIPTWKIPFIEFITGKINLEDLEKKIYEQSELEFILGKNLYIDLVCFNFKNRLIYGEVFRLILDKILIEEDEYFWKLYGLIGEYYLNDIKLKTRNSKTLPEAVLAIFEGAHIHVKWNGVDNPTCDVEFYTEVFFIKNRYLDCTKVLPPSTVQIGEAFNADISLYMDEDGIMYFHFIDGKLYKGGEFLEALKILFFGLKYGELICSPDN